MRSAAFGLEDFEPGQNEAAPLGAPPGSPSSGSTGATSAARGAKRGGAAPGSGIDPAEHAKAVARAAAEAHARGYEEGAAAALAQSETETTLLLARIAEAVADFAMTGHAARAAAERALGPLLAASLAALAPSLARTALPGEIAARLIAILARAPDPRLRLTLHPEMVAPVETALRAGGIALDRVAFESRADCPALTARLGWADGFDEIDPAAAAAELCTALAPLLTPHVDPITADAAPGSDAPADAPEAGIGVADAGGSRAAAG